jgi:uncharacterized membrane protein (DUF485 family)
MLLEHGEEDPMTESHGGGAERANVPPRGGGAAGLEHRPDIDWAAAERLPEFRELVKTRRKFVVPATIFFLAWYFGFIILAGYAEDFMGESIYEGFTVGYLLALSQFIMVWTLSWLYVRKADRDFDPLARKAAETALEAGRRGRADGNPGAGREVRPS